MSRARRHVTTWIAVLAVLMTMLAPAVSRALGARGPASWSEICTSAGAQRLLLDESGSEKQPVPGTAHLLDHCPYCALHTDGLPLPPVVCACPPPVRVGERLPLAFLHAEKTLSIWSSAQPRAPPSSI